MAKKERSIETYQNLLMKVSKDQWEALERADRLEKALTRACMYLTKGYMDNSDKNNYSVMQWEELILKEVDDAEWMPF